ncbi:MAG: GGDEF domain-containing protein [Ignavibacteriae bacterium]|nr:MAG: GGDEF domain-containing protein [Ignavibacteriota bacterium]
MSHLKPEECLHFFSEVLSILNSTHEPERVLSLIVDRIVRMYGCQTCAVIIIDPATEYLHVLTNHNLSHRYVKEFRRPLGTGAIARMLSTGKPILIADSVSDSQLAAELQLEYPFRSAVCLQISAELRTLGYLFADARDPETFTGSDIRILQSFADLSSIALNKSYLYEKNLRLDRIDHETELEKYAPFLERLSASISRAEENHESISLFMLDIDNYKQMGGTYGYEASKKVLKEVAGLVKSHLRPMDAASRYGFDEIIFLRENTSLEVGMTCAEGLRKAVEETPFTPQAIHTTVSIGAASYPQNARTEKELLIAVKEALYDAQRSGRNKVAHG